jgi:uncharacterized protein (DUF1330 family)
VPKQLARLDQKSTACQAARLIGEASMPKGYIYAELEVTDPALFETYRPLAAASIAAFGGRYAVRGGDPKVLEGSDPPPRSVLLEFDSPERAMEWYNSQQYQAALQVRLRSAKTKVVMLTGNSDG